MKTSFPIKTFCVVIIFSIAMAMLESAVVIYLRNMLYPTGFSFPLKALEMNMSMVEISREFATLIMLVTVGMLAGFNRNTRFAYFLLSFAIWDIFYYVFLKLFLNWPESLATWDVLFLIPTMWVGPVWAPVLLSLTMIALAIILIQVNAKGNVNMGSSLWLMIVGTIICVVSFCWDVFVFMQKNHDAKWYDISLIFKSDYIPTYFPLPIFLLGYGIIVFAIWRYFKGNQYSLFQLNRAQLL